MTVNSRWARLKAKIANKAYRDGYVSAHVRSWVANQIRVLRKERNLSQSDFAAKLGKPQSVVSRMEDPSYGKLTIQSLLAVASACDVALEVRFVSFPDFLQATRDLASDALAVESFSASISSMEPAAVGIPFIVLSDRATAKSRSRVLTAIGGNSDEQRVVVPAVGSNSGVSYV